MHHPDLRTVPRYFLNPSLNGFAGGRTVRVVDLAVKGARLEHVEPFDVGADVNLAMLAGDHDVNVKASVLWCELDSLQLTPAQDRYLTGVAFRGDSLMVSDLIHDLLANNAAMLIEDARAFDRYHISAPLTASFGPYSPVSLLDLSLRGARIETGPGLEAGETGQLIFQVDDASGPIDVMARVMWSSSTPEGAFRAGLLVEGFDDDMRAAIHNLCRRGEAHPDLSALRRKFDALRAESLRQSARGAA